MPWFPLRVIQTEYELTPGNRLTTFRHMLHVEVGGANWLQPRCFFDTGAQISVVSHYVAQNLGAVLTPIPVQHGPIPTFEDGAPVQPTPNNNLLGWWDPIAQQLIPCVLAELTVQLRNRHTGTTSDPLRLVAKALQAPARPFGGSFVLLGVHFLAANGGQLHLASQPWGLGGPGLFFPP
jgi:hypothetical protein